jgi:hypothetical protein
MSVHMHAANWFQITGRGGVDRAHTRKTAALELQIPLALVTKKKSFLFDDQCEC